MTDGAIAFLRDVGDRLIKYADFIPGFGLMDGKLGVVLFLFACSKATGQEKYGESANSLLDDIFDGISLESPLDFDTGLCGLSYGVKYAVDNSYIDPDSMEVLTDLDGYIIEHGMDMGADDLFTLTLYWKHRGNELQFQKVSSRLAQIKGISYDELVNITTKREHGGEVRFRDIIRMKEYNMKFGQQIPLDVIEKKKKTLIDKDLLQEFIELSRPSTMNLRGNMLGFGWALVTEI